MTAPFPKKVTQYLEEVSYAVNKDYVPSTFSLEMVNLIKLIDGGMTENVTPTVHLKILDSFVDINNRDIINLCHRGLAKSTLLEYLIFRIALYGELPNLGKIPHMIFVGDAMDGGVKKMRKALENRYINSDFLQKYLKDIKFTDNRWEFIRKDGKSLVVSAYGGKTNIRGTRENGSRPVLALLDDIITDSDARSPTEIENINTNINNAVEFALHPTRRKVIWNGTPYNASDPLYTAVESGTYHVNVYPVCEKFPCREEDFRGSWEERFPYSALLTMYTKLEGRGKAGAFYQEMMLQILSDDTRLISDSDLKWYSRAQLIKNLANFNIVITTDFATSEKQHGDFSFISVWAVNNRGYRFWLDGICKRQTMDKNLDDLFRLAQMYRPISVGIEVSGQQGGFIPWIEQEMMNRNIFFPLASDNNSGKAGIRPSTDKLQRFNTVVPYFKKGEMYFPAELKHTDALSEMITELLQVTIGGFKSKQDDALDTISMLSLMPIWLPSETAFTPLHGVDLWGMDDGQEVLSSMNNYLV